MRQYYGYPPYGYYPYPYPYPYYGYYRPGLLPFFLLLPFLFRGEDGEEESRVYTVEEGDVMREIAQSNNVPLSMLLAANPQIQNPSVLKAGDKVNIPNLANMQCYSMYMETGQDGANPMNFLQGMQSPVSQMTMPPGYGQPTYPPSYGSQIPQTTPTYPMYGGQSQADGTPGGQYPYSMPGSQGGYVMPGAQQPMYSAPGSQGGYVMPGAQQPMYSAPGSQGGYMMPGAQQPYYAPGSPDQRGGIPEDQYPQSATSTEDQETAQGETGTDYKQGS